MFTREEAQALVASVRVARPHLDDELAAHAEAALAKIVGVLPPVARAAAESMALLAPADPLEPAMRDRLRALRQAAEGRRRVRFEYVDQHGAPSSRLVRPLACVYWGAVWTLAAWCETRTDFRNFRLDRIRRLDVLDERFRDEPGRTLPDLLRRVGADRER